MKEEVVDLIAALCTQAAMIMEDVVVSALTIGSVENDQRMARLQELSEAADCIRRLIDAARTLET